MNITRNSNSGVEVSGNCRPFCNLHMSLIKKNYNGIIFI